MSTKTADTFYATTRKAWRQWLSKNHKSKQSVWLIQYKKNAGKPTISWSEAVDEALCFGWIDSTRKSIDDERFMQFFSKRKAKSSWSKINKEKVKQLIADGLMTEAGLASIETAKQNGSWEILDAVEELTMPPDLEKEFRKHRGSKAFFTGLSKSVRKAILQWITLAKRPETKAKRIAEVAMLAGQGQKPKQF